MDNPNLDPEYLENEEDIDRDSESDAVDILKVEYGEEVRPVFTAASTVTLNCVVRLGKAVGNPQIHLEVKGKVRVQYEGRTLENSSGLRKSKRRKVREKMIFIRPVVLSPAFLEAGDHVIPFTLELPYNLRTSFESPMGSVRYWIQPNSAFHAKTSADLFYFDVNGLNCFIQRGIPREKSYAESVRGMFFSKSPVELICSVEWEGCEIGESVPVTVKVHSSHRKIKYVNIELCREISNFLGDPAVTVVTTTKVKLASVFKTLKSWKGNVVIPDDLRPEAFQIKGFFSVTYFFRFSALTTFSTNFNVKIPIKIGNKLPSMESLTLDKSKWKELEEFYEQTGLKGYTSIMSLDELFAPSVEDIPNANGLRNAKSETQV